MTARFIMYGQIGDMRMRVISNNPTLITLTCDSITYHT